MLNCEYPEYDGVADTDNAASLNRHLEYDICRQSWTLGLAPQSYAMKIGIPLYVINSANSSYVDIEQINKTGARLNRFVYILRTGNLHVIVKQRSGRDDVSIGYAKSHNWA